MLGPLGLAAPGGLPPPPPPRASQFLATADNSPAGAPFLTHRSLLPVFITAGPGISQLPRQNPLKLSNHPSYTCSPCLTHSFLRTHNKGSCPVLPSLPRPPDPPRGFPVGPPHEVVFPLLLGTVSSNLFNGSGLLTWRPHHTTMRIITKSIF